MFRHLPAIVIAASLSACALLPSSDAASEQAAVEIPYTRHTLDNGLTVVLHEDHKAPIVAVNVWYHVGSKDEKPGRTGFAHLFEHLMFQGSENYPDEYFKPFEKVGATTMNGTTWLDRTNYFQNVPTTALDLALWMESDRMGHFLGVVTQDLLDEQRGVVQNEKRQGKNRPYGDVWEHLQRASFPEGHPYRWETIGSMEDLNAASLEDVKEWFRSYYGAANATLVIAGDIDPEATLAKVKSYFGDINPGPPVSRREQWVAARDQSTREVLQDRVAQARVHRAWNVPAFGDAAADDLEIAASLLGGGKTSRLYERLVYDEQLADSVSAYVLPFEIAGLFVIQADVKQGVSVAAVESAIDAELARLLDEGPTRDELERVKVDLESGFVRGIETIGGFGGKSDVLARHTVYLDDPAAWKTSLERLRSASPERIRDTTQQWLAQGDHSLIVKPFGNYAASDEGIDRSDGPPITESYPSLLFPDLERTTLSNGIEVVLAHRSQTPIVDVSLQFDAGYAADVGVLSGTSALTMAMLDEGTPTRDALDIARETERLGARLSASAGLDTSQVSVSAVTPRLAPSLDLLADVTRNPLFDADEFARVQAQWLARIAQEKTRPASMALRTLPPLIYGDGHPYAMPFTGSGTEQSIQALTPTALRTFHRRWIRPDNLTILVAGDTTLDAISPLLEARFGDWAPPAEPAGRKTIADAELAEASHIYLIDRPDAEQSVIFGGHLAPSTRDPRRRVFEVVEGVLGGSFTARLNMNLREDKHWSYGARTTTPNTVGQRPLMFYAPVQTDKTSDSLAEIDRELREYITSRPATEAEVAKVKSSSIRSLPGRYETTGAVMSALASIERFDWPDDYVQTLKARIEAVSVADVRKLTPEVIHPDRVTWVIVGDRDLIEGPIRALDLAPVTVLQGDTP